jgi:hypothetical protein
MHEVDFSFFNRENRPMRMLSWIIFVALVYFVDKGFPG